MNKKWPSGRLKGWSLNGDPKLSSFNFEFDWMPQKDEIEIVQLALPSALKDFERGAIIRPNINITGGKNGLSIRDNHGFDPDTIRASLLFFDRLVYPDNSFYQIGNVERDLPGLTCVESPRSSLSGTLNQDVLAFVAAQTFEALEQREPGRWSFARSAQNCPMPARLLTGEHGLKMRLQNALPVPDRGVSYDEVLNYRERRRPELLALRSHMEGIVIEVSGQGFGGLAETRAMEDFKRSLSEYARVAREENFLKRMSNVEISFNWSSALIAAGAAYTHSFELAALAGLKGLLELKSSIRLKKQSSTPHPFDYVFKAGAEM